MFVLFVGFFRFRTELPRSEWLFLDDCIYDDFFPKTWGEKIHKAINGSWRFSILSQCMEVEEKVQLTAL